jgi:hypothetical protein
MMSPDTVTSDTVIIGALCRPVGPALALFVNFVKLKRSLATQGFFVQVVPLDH